MSEVRTESVKRGPTMAMAIIRSALEVDQDRHVAFHDVGWKGYNTLLRLRGEQSWPRMIYLDGTVWLMSPTFPHERLKTRLGEFVTEVVVGLRIPFLSAAEIRGWVTQSQSAGELEWIMALRRWVRRVLRPRVRRQQPEDPGG
jgi:hypothetical protein